MTKQVNLKKFRKISDQMNQSQEKFNADENVGAELGEKEHRDEAAELQRDYSKMPPEMLFHIFGFLKPEDNCMTPLSECCVKFKDICLPRLRVLNLDFDKILRTKCHPTIMRAYKEIRMTGKQIEGSRRALQKALGSSKDSASKLIIKAKDGPFHRCKIKIRTLILVLKALPNLKEVEFINVHCGVPRVSSSKAIQSSELPKLSNLRKLTFTNSAAVPCLAFREARKIQDLRLDLSYFRNNYERELFGDLVTAQQELKVFHSNARIRRHFFNEGNLETFAARMIEHVISNNTRIEHIQIAGSGIDFFPILTELLTAGPIMASLKTFECRSLFAGDLDINQLRSKFPSLEYFENFNNRWKI